MQPVSPPFPLSTLRNVAIVSGSFLSGAMITLSTITLPVFLDTTTHPSLLLNQWARTYHYGHLALPTLSVATTFLYTFIALTQSSAGKPWRRAAAAGIVTITMVPFTWVCMSGTNERLFELQRMQSGIAGGGGVGAGGNVKGTEGEGEVDFEGVRVLLVKWGWMHFTRSLFPLVGAVVGNWLVV